MKDNVQKLQENIGASKSLVKKPLSLYECGNLTGNAPVYSSVEYRAPTFCHMFSVRLCYSFIIMIFSAAQVICSQQGDKHRMDINIHDDWDSNPTQANEIERLTLTIAERNALIYHIIEANDAMFYDQIGRKQT